MPVPVGSVRPCSSTPGGRVAGPLPPPTNACRTVLRPASVPSQALQRLHLPSRKVPAAERQRVRAAEAGTPQTAMAGVTPGSCGRLCPDSVPRTLPTGAPVYCSASRVTPTPCSVGGSLSTSQGSVGAGEIGPPARGPMRLPMCRAARSVGGQPGQWVGPPQWAPPRPPPSPGRSRTERRGDLGSAGDGARKTAARGQAPV